MDPTEKLFEYTCPRTPEYYNQFFNPNLCHVCKRPHLGNKDKFNLIKCKTCNMISYCSMKHKNLHLQQHRNICQAIEHVSKTDISINQNILRQTLFEWTKSKKQFLRCVKIDLGRELSLYEEQMLMFRKSCCVCHQQIDLKTCPKCYSSCFCSDHDKLFSTLHKDKCEKFILMLNLDILSAQSPEISLNVDWSKLVFCNSDDFVSTAAFIMKYVPNERKKGKTGEYQLISSDYIYSDYISGPLTLHYGIYKAQLFHLFEKDDLTIHVIAASAVDQKGVSAWEMFLHFVGEIKRLTIIMTGPELTFNHCEYDTCSTCKKYNKIFNYKCYPMLYHNYVASPEYKKPDVIIGFQAHLYSKSLFDKLMWDESILALKKQDCPLFLTTYNITGATKEQIKIQQVLHKNIIPSFTIKNIYKGCRPYRNFIDEFVFYRNEWLMYYTDLNAEPLPENEVLSPVVCRSRL